MGFLGSLAKAGGQAAQVLGAGYEGAGQDKAIALQQAFAARAQNRDDLLANIKAQMDAASTAKITHENMAPVLGEQGHPAAVAADAGAVAGAQVAPDIAKAVGIEKGTQPIKTQGALDVARGMIPIKVAEIGATAQPAAKAAGLKAGEESQAKLPGELQVASARAGMSPMAQRAQAALPQIQTSHAILSKFDEPGALGRLLAGRSLGAYFTTTEGQNAIQAATELARNHLSIQTGRPATPEAIKALRDEILVQPGEEGNPAVISAKAMQRKQMVDQDTYLGHIGTPGAPPSTDAPANTALTPAEAAYLKAQGHSDAAIASLGAKPPS
jgi:hypothetical protein